MRHDLEYVEKIEKELEKYNSLFLTAKEVADLLRVSQRLVNYHCANGEIFAVKVGSKKKGRWVIFKESLIEFVLRRNNYEVF